jgi:hypothetical protein
MGDGRPRVSGIIRSMKILRASAFVVTFAIAAQGCHRSKGGDGSADGGAAAIAGSPAAAGPLAFLQGFEGEIGITAKSNKGKQEAMNLAFDVKSDKIRVEIPPGIGGPKGPSFKGYVILNTPEKKLYAVLDDQKQVIVVDLNTAGEQFKSMVPKAPSGPSASNKPSKPPPKVTKTGTSDKVAGYACDNWEVTEETKKVATLCVTDQSNSWFHLPLTGIPTEYAWTLELLDGKHFPMRAIGYENGAESGRVEVTKMEKKPMAAALFEIPAGYKVIDAMTYVQQMMRGVGAMPGSAPGVGLAGLPPKKPK